MKSSHESKKGKKKSSSTTQKVNSSAATVLHAASCSRGSFLSHRMEARAVMTTLLTALTVAPQR
jgi:hypothetical protein